jgi:activator of HSP90 ATPase
MIMRTRTIRQRIDFSADPHDLYETLMDSKKHSEFTGSKCVISRKVGGKVSAYDGYITGENIELELDKKIVQTWRAEEDCWPADHYSRVIFVLKPTKSGTRLTFTHSGVPVDCGDRFDTGWQEQYWTPMQEMFSKMSLI